MRHPIVRIRQSVALIICGLTLALAAGCAQPAPAQPAQYSADELAFIAEMTRILDVPAVDPEGSLAGGRNACYWIDEYELDRATLAGWDEHWSEPWERQWLEAAVRHLCPVATAAGR